VHYKIYFVEYTIGDQVKLSCLICSCVHTANATRQDSFVASHYWVHTATRTRWTRSRRDKTVLSAVWTQLKTTQNCLVSSRRQCEEAITV